MRIISFAWTTPALLAAEKTVTRRAWKDAYALTFRAGERLQAWNASPRTGKGRQVGVVELTADPVKQSTARLPDSEWVAEGFACIFRIGQPDACNRALAIWNEWMHHPRDLWVVRFRLVDADV